MNTVQKNYLTSTALVETLRELLDELEKAFLISTGYKENGKTPTALFTIEDDETFDRLCLEFDNMDDVKTLNAQYSTAKRQAVKSEKELVKYGLSLLPPAEREVLTKAVETNINYRNKVIDLTMKLDTKTVKR